MINATAVLLSVGLVGVPLTAQWIHYPTAGLPRLANGKPDLSAPTPRTKDGKPDFSGVWEVEHNRPCPPGGCDDMWIPQEFLNIGWSLKDGLPYRPWAAEVVKRTQLLDIAAAALGEASAGDPIVRRCGPTARPRPADGLLVADLSSLWAGPLCAQLLVRSGATVVKVESPKRPDGTRRGEPAFFDWMNAGKLCYAVDFDTQADAVRRLLGVADIVIEGSRPAALQRRRLDAENVAGRPGRIWLRINGYHDQPGRPAFGDDAAVAGGLVGDGPVFLGDAIADPLSGLEAARAIGESLRRGGGEVIDVAMAQVAARYAAMPPSPAPTADAPAVTPASALGADNDTVDRLVAERC